MLYCCTWRNIEDTRYKHLVDPLPRTTCHGRAQLSTLRSEARYRRFAFFGLLLGDSRRNIVVISGVVKLEWCGYPMVKNFWRYVYSFWQNSRTWWTDGRTDRQTPHDDYSRAYAYSIAPQKRLRITQMSVEQVRQCKTDTCPAMAVIVWTVFLNGTTDWERVKN